MASSYFFLVGGTGQNLFEGDGSWLLLSCWLFGHYQPFVLLVLYFKKARNKMGRRKS